MKFGRHLLENMEADWEEYYVPYRKLKKMIKALVAKNVGIQPTYFQEVSLSAPPPTNAAAQVDEDMESVTQETFFEEISRQLERMEEFTDTKVNQIKEELKALQAKIGTVPNKEVETDVAQLAGAFLRLEKYVNLNITAFRKILKKHDKRLPNPAKAFYMDRIHQQAWVRGDYSDVMSTVGGIYAQLRGDTAAGGDTPADAQGGKKLRTVYWIRNEDISKVKYILLQHLPAAEVGGGGGGDSRLVSAVYLDNAPLELYHALLESPSSSTTRGRLESAGGGAGGAAALRVAWEGAGAVEKLVVERTRRGVRAAAAAGGAEEAKGGGGGGGGGAGSSLADPVVWDATERFPVDEAGVAALLAGRFDPAREAVRLRRAGALRGEGDEGAFAALAPAVAQMVVSKQLAPSVRTQFMRAVYKGQALSAARPVPAGGGGGEGVGEGAAGPRVASALHITLDSNVVMVDERAKLAYKAHAPTPAEFFQPWGTPGEVLARTGSYSQQVPFAQNSIAHLPFATLEVELTTEEDRRGGGGDFEADLVPAWLTQLVTSGLLTQVDGFSKYLHAAGTFCADEVQAQPPWLRLPMYQELSPMAMVTGPAPGGRGTQAAPGGGTLGGGRRGTVLSHLMDERRLLTGKYHAGQVALPPMRSVYEHGDEERDGACCAGCLGCLEIFQAPAPQEGIEPMVKPKIYMANERTFIKWVHIAVYMAALGAALLSFETVTEASTVTLSLSLLAISFMFIVYATVMHNSRAVKIRRGVAFRWDDPWGPTVMALAFSAALLYNFLDQLYLLLAALAEKELE